MEATLQNHLNPEFQAIRDADGLTEDNIFSSLDLEQNIDKIFQVGLGAGKSGSFFFYSHDHKLIIKTVSSQEKKDLMAKIDSICAHLAQPEGSLLARIYGLFSISSTQFAKMSFVLMQNVTRYKEMNSHRLTFDLKGSQFKRYAQINGKPNQVLKDLNFQELQRSSYNGQLVNLPEHLRTQIA